MNPPPYFKQEKNHTCSLAVLRMVLEENKIKKSEAELEEELFLITKNKLRNIPNIMIYELATSLNLKASIYDSLDKRQIKKLLLNENALIQLSVKLAKLYTGKHGLHSVLLYRIDGDNVIYHDPAYGESLICTLDQIINANRGTGKIIVF